MTLPDYVLQNREHWDKQAAGYVASGERHWAQPDPTWGIWNIPEADLRMPTSPARTRSSWDAERRTSRPGSRGARVVGIDNSEQQLETARRLQQQHALQFPLIHGNAEAVPYPDQSFDFAISEYGACLWADPRRWVAEAARLLRPGGRLHFLTNAFLLMLCVEEDETKPATDRLLRPAFGIYRMEWPGDSGIEFHLSHADWIPAPPGRGLRDRGPHRHPPTRGRDDALSFRVGGVGAEVALGRSVEGAEARVIGRADAE